MNRLIQNSLISIIGGLPVLAIALHACNIVDLKTSALCLVFPAWIVLVLMFKLGDKMETFLKYWSAGVIAVFLYDLSRIPFIYFGWDDFIPKIGFALGFENEQATIAAYAWRYIFNGGGLALSFLGLQRLIPELKQQKVLYGMAYGVIIWLCLDIVLFLAQDGAMFPPTPFNIIGSYVGHVVYGCTLVLMLSFYSRIQLKIEKSI